MLSPPCTMFSQLQGVNPHWGTNAWKAKLEHAKELMNFACRVAYLQHRLGGTLVIEQPLGASSWGLPAVRDLLNVSGVQRIRTDLCAYGLMVQMRVGPHWQ